MNPRIEKINEEYQKNAAKLDKLQARQKELERQRTELENNEILGLVRSHSLTAAQLADLIQAMKTNPAATLAGVRESEDSTHEET